MVKVGVIGLGMGSSHLEGYSKIPDIKILAISDLKGTLLKERAKKFGVPYAFSDYHKMLQLEELDAVSIALPNFLHCPVTLEALKAEKHVLIEKPMAMNSPEAEEMIKRAKEKKKILAVSMNHRYTPERQFLKKMIRAGELGEIYYVKGVWIRKKTFGFDGLIQNAYTWFVQKEKSGGGVLIDLGVHLLDLSFWFLNNFKPISVSGVVSSRFKNGDVDDFVFALIRMKSGATISLELTWESFVKEEKFFSSLLGTKGGAETNPLKIYKEMEGIRAEVIPCLPEINDTIQSHFIDCIREGREPEVSGEKGLAVIKVIDAVYESAKTGKEMKIS